MTQDRRGGGYLLSAGLRPVPGVNSRRFPYTLPVFKALALADIVFDPGVTFLVGENGSGKSTLIEALAAAAGFNKEGGSRSFRFSTRVDDSESIGSLVLRRSPRRPSTDFFLRAETFFNVATEIDRLDEEMPGLHERYGGGSLHSRSHGEAFLDLVTYRFGPRGLYLLDEPEAALSVRGVLALMARIHELVGLDSQFVVATHSPVLLALPGASIVELDQGVRRVPYAEAGPVVLTRQFLDGPEQFLRHLLDGAEPE